MPKDWQDALKTLSKTVKTNNQPVIKKLPEEELNFAQAIGQVEPIKKSHRYVFTKEKPKPITLRTKESTVDPHLTTFITDDFAGDVPPAQYSKGGQGKKDIQRLMHGKIPLVATLDLHGYNQEEAQQILNEFIDYVQQRGVAAQIIHGSGLNSRGFVAKLKIMVRKWLMTHPEVLAYTQPSDSNDGCVLVLLKRKYHSNHE